MPIPVSVPLCDGWLKIESDKYLLKLFFRQVVSGVRSRHGVDAEPQPAHSADPSGAVPRLSGRGPRLCAHARAPGE